MKNHNPYSNQNNPYRQGVSPWRNNNDFNNQKQLDKDRQEQQYKFAAEQGADNIVQDYFTAMQNHVPFVIKQTDKAPIIRYFKRYKDNQFMALSMIIMLITFMASFYTPLAVSGIFFVFLLREAYSQLVYVNYLFNDHDLSRTQILELKNQIFFKQLRSRTSFVITVVLIIISYIVYFYSKNILLANFFIDKQFEWLLKLLNMPSPFYLENEMFAYANVVAILILLWLKVYEKWSK